MLSDSKYWETDTISLLKILLTRIPVLSKYVTQHGKCIVQSLGAIGILLTFSAGYGCAHSTRILATTAFLVMVLINLPAVFHATKDFNAEFLNLFKTIAIIGGLLQEC